jgi:hypothetical protein
MPRHTRALGLELQQSFEKYVYNLTSHHNLDMQPPCELDNSEKQKWLQKQLRYRRPNNSPIAENDGNTELCTDKGTNGRPMLHPSFQGLQKEEILPVNSTPPLNKEDDNLICSKRKGKVPKTSVSAINNRKKGEFHNLLNFMQIIFIKTHFFFLLMQT